MNLRHKQLGHIGEDGPGSDEADGIDWPFWIVMAVIGICAWLSLR